MMLDMRGKEIKIGSTVAYPDRRGSNLWQNIAKVISVSASRWDYAANDYVPVLKVRGENGNDSVVRRLDRVVVVR